MQLAHLDSSLLNLIQKLHIATENNLKLKFFKPNFNSNFLYLPYIACQACLLELGHKLWKITKASDSKAERQMTTSKDSLFRTSIMFERLLNNIYTWGPPVYCSLKAELRYKNNTKNIFWTKIIYTYQNNNDLINFLSCSKLIFQQNEFSFYFRQSGRKGNSTSRDCFTQSFAGQ